MKQGMEENREGSVIADQYPPDIHILRDLRVSLEFQGQGRAVIRAPVVPEIRTQDGSLQVGAVATLIDVLGGALTARAVYPDWIATASLSVHMTGRPVSDTVVAAGEVIRAGRTMDRTIHPPTAQQRTVGSIDNRIERKTRNIGLNDLDRRHESGNK